MKHIIAAGALLALALLLAGCSSGGSSSPTATPTPTTAPTTTVKSTPVPLDQLFTITVFPPSCQANGYSVYVNNETGAINIRDEVPRLMHEYGDWEQNEDGMWQRVCQSCGHVDVVDATPSPSPSPTPTASPTPSPSPTPKATT